MRCSYKAVLDQVSATRCCSTHPSPVHTSHPVCPTPTHCLPSVLPFPIPHPSPFPSDTPCPKPSLGVQPRLSCDLKMSQDHRSFGEGVSGSGGRWAMVTKSCARSLEPVTHQSGHQFFLLVHGQAAAHLGQFFAPEVGLGRGRRGVSPAPHGSSA